MSVAVELVLGLLARVDLLVEQMRFEFALLLRLVVVLGRILELLVDNVCIVGVQLAAVDILPYSRFI